MRVKRLLETVSSITMATMLAFGASAQNAPRIGVASAVTNQVEGVIGTDSRLLATGSSVFARELVRTGAESTAQLLFIDQTSLTVGPHAEVTLDRFVFDPNRGAGNVTIDLGRGALRFVSGSQQSSSYRIRTDVATIGIRGTAFDVRKWQAPDGKWMLVLILISGEVVCDFGGQQFVLNQPGQAILFGAGPGPQLVNYDGRSFFAMPGNPPLPLFSNVLLGDQFRVESFDGVNDFLDQAYGAGQCVGENCFSYYP